MEEGGKKAAGAAASSSRVNPSFVRSGDRQVFTVELRPGDTTIVSWKKLLKDANKARNGSSSAVIATVAGPSSSAAAQAALQPHPLPGQENEAKDGAAPNRFSAVIEKIERLYMGKDSSDEEDLNEVPDDDQYDTEDSFIDDAELDEYFEVDNAAVKHDGFFINRGKLECINETPAPPSQQPKKRRRRDLTKGSNEKDDGVLPNKHMKVGKTSSGKDAAPVGSNSSNSSQNLTLMRERNEDAKASNQFNMSGTGPKKKSADNTRGMERQKAGVPVPKSVNSKLKDPSGSTDVLHHKYHDRSSLPLSKSQAGRSAEEFETSNRREKHGICEVPDLNMPDSRHMEISPDSGSAILQKQHMHRKDGASVRPKVSLLEKAIRDLEKMVAESRPPVAENTETDISSQAVKRRLPTDIKLKLARVAKLASTHGKLSKELINRLNGIVGHLVQLRTLKRNLKMMVNTSLSAKQEKENRFQQIKKEVADMVRVRVLSLDSRHQAGASDDFQELGPYAKGLPPTKYDMDPAMEDKICDLYDLYIDGLDEETGPQIRKLYSELAQLWPNGFMDNHGIKSAICRSKERKRVVLNSRHKDQARIRRKKLLTPKTETAAGRAESGSTTQSQHTSQSQHSLERLAAEPSIHTSANRQVPSTSALRAPSPRNGPSSDKAIKQERAKGSLISPVDDPRVAEGAQLPKKVKRKPEVDLNEMPYPVEKLPTPRGDERLNTNPLRPGGSSPHKSSLKQSSAASFEQSS